MTYWKLVPEVAAEMGHRSAMDTTVHPARVERLHLHFMAWLGDDLVETFPCFAATERLCEALTGTPLTGYRFAAVETTVDEQFSMVQPGSALPEFRWLVVEHTSPVRGDCSLGHDGSLIVSDLALEMLWRFRLDQCAIEPLGDGVE